MSAADQPSFPYKWKWTFENGYSINAQLENNPSEGWILSVFWTDPNDARKHQPLFVHPEHGPEWLESLAKFVAAVRHGPDAKYVTR